MNGTTLNGRQIFCGRAMDKKERSSHYEGVNLYIKNLDDDFDDDRLRKEFSKFGNITSAKVRRKRVEGGRKDMGGKYGMCQSLIILHV